MKVFLAGTSSLSRNKDILRNCKYFLESFYSVKPWQMEYLLGAEDFLLDSGAFTFMNSKSRVDFDEYVKKYASFIKEYDIKSFFELDIESIVGWDEYVRLNKKLESLSGKKPIKVFHKERGKEWFLRAVKEESYIAYGGIAVDRKTMKKKDIEIIKWFIDKAHENKCKIHGLGFTSTSFFDRIRFDTIDSTTWTIGGRMGNLCYMTRDGEMRQYYPSKTGKKPREGVMNEIVRYNFLQWCKYQKYMEDK